MSERGGPARARHLVHDDVEAFSTSRDGPGAVPYRVRVWRSTGTAPVVLVSEHLGPGGAPLSRHATLRIANYIHGGILRFPAAGMHYFEADICPQGGPRLWLVEFEQMGHHDRARMVRHHREQRRWEEIERMVGQAVAP